MEKKDAAIASSADVRIFEAESYIQGRSNRLRNLFLHIDPQSLAGKRVLEPGCGTGEIGAEFERLGGRVVSIDSRRDYIAALAQKFPGREACLMDLERWDPSALGSFDVVVCFGILYHLSQPAAFLTSCAALAPEVYMETVVCDSEEVTCPIVAEEGPDQAYSGRGCRPSPAWIAKVLDGCGFDAEDISSGTANWGGGAPSVFDWTPRNNGSWMRDGALLRKMFICRRRSH